MLILIPLSLQSFNYYLKLCSIMDIELDYELLHNGVSQTLTGIETILKCLGTQMEHYDEQTALTIALLGSLTVSAGKGLANENGENGLKAMKQEVESTLADTRETWMKLLAGSQDMILKSMMG